MQPIKIATAQFEHRSNDKSYNLAVIRQLAEQAKSQGAQVIAFHECSIAGYTFARHLVKEQLTAVPARAYDNGVYISNIATSRKDDLLYPH